MHSEVHKWYVKFKPKFVLFAQRIYGIPLEDGEDIFHESFMKMCENLQEGKYKDTGRDLYAYLLGIGKNYIRKYWDKKGRECQVEYTFAQEWLINFYGNEEWEQAQEVAQKLIYESAKDCNKILQLFYWERKRMTEIADLMGYKTEQVAKNKKQSCLQRIAIELKGRLKNIGINWK